MRVKTIFVIFLLQILCRVSCAQIFDSLNFLLNNKPTFYFRLDNRNSFIQSRNASFSGIKLGLDYEENLALGLGFTFIQNNSIFSIFKGNVNHSFDGYLKLAYFTPFVEYNFYKSSKWNHSIPVQFGLGWASLSDNSSNTELYSIIKPVFLYEPMMSSEYKINSFLSLGFGIGYRVLLINNKYFGRYFNSPTYMFNLNVFWDHFYFKIKQK